MEKDKVGVTAFIVAEWRTSWGHIPASQAALRRSTARAGGRLRVAESDFDLHFATLEGLLSSSAGYGGRSGRLNITHKCLKADVSKSRHVSAGRRGKRQGCRVVSLGGSSALAAGDVINHHSAHCCCIPPALPPPHPSRPSNCAHVYPCMREV